MEPLTVTLTVEQLRNLIYTADRLSFILNGPFRANETRRLELRLSPGWFEDADPVLTVDERLNEKVVRSARIAISEIFNLAPRVRELLDIMGERDERTSLQRIVSRHPAWKICPTWSEKGCGCEPVFSCQDEPGPLAPMDLDQFDSLKEASKDFAETYDSYDHYRRVHYAIHGTDRPLAGSQ